MVGSTSDATPMEIVEESILDVLDSGYDDTAMDPPPVDDEEFQAMVKEYEAELTMDEASASNMEKSVEYSPTCLEDLTADEFFAYSAEEQEVLMAGRGRPKKKPAGAVGEPNKEAMIPKEHNA